MNQNCIDCFEVEIEEHNDNLELLLDKQDYLDYIDSDMEAFYSIKAEAVQDLTEA